MPSGAEVIWARATLAEGRANVANRINFADTKKPFLNVPIILTYGSCDMSPQG